MHPFIMNHRSAEHARIDLSFLLDCPAGKDGFVTVRDGHLVRPDGTRLRLWGVNVTDWSDGSILIPSKKDAPFYAATLARFGVNCVRLHFLDFFAPRGLIDPTRDDSQHFDADQLDRLDFWIAELKNRGIYIDLNLAVGRTYKAGDAVRDYDQIGWAKAITYFDPRLIELQKSYAARLLTHYNPYTGAEYRHDPAIVIVELINENSLVEAWRQGRLHPVDGQASDANWRPITTYYADTLDRLYNEYLDRLRPEELARIRALAGITAKAPMPRLRPDEFAAAPAEQFHAEAALYIEIERSYFRDMKAFLKETLGVRSLLIGSNDHNHNQSGYPTVSANALLDILDGHVYWQHPDNSAERNTPMVNDPCASTIARLSRTSLVGQPFIVSEVNHVFPNDWISEGIPILAAYAGFQDWDGIIWYTFEPKANPGWEPYIGDAFDISLDPVRMPQIAAGALAFLRGDVSPAVATIERTYTAEQVRASLRLNSNETPYYTPGFPPSLVFRHKVRVGSLDGSPTEPLTALDMSPVVSDTDELCWHTAPEGNGLVIVDTPRAQALIGFVRANRKSTRNLIANVANTFCAVTLTSLDGQPIAHSGRLLLTVGGRVENAGQQWNDTRTVMTDHGGPPSLIERVSGRIVLKCLENVTSVLVYALDGAGRPNGEAQAKNTSEGWAFAIGDPVTTWYEILVAR